MLIPVIWVTTGGSTGGSTLWFVYELFYIVLFAREGALLAYLVPAVLLQIGCFVLEGLAPQYVFNYPNQHDAYISLIGSFVVITS